MPPEVSLANLWINWVCRHICPLVLLQYHSRTYWDHRHRDAHGHEHRVGHCAALIGEPDAVVIAEESSLVRWEGRLVQKHSNNQRCMVGQTWAEVRQRQQWTAASTDIIKTKRNRKAHTDISDNRLKNSQQTCASVIYIVLFSKVQHGCCDGKIKQNKHSKICWSQCQTQSNIIWS